MLNTPPFKGLSVPIDKIIVEHRSKFGVDYLVVVDFQVKCGMHAMVITLLL